METTCAHSARPNSEDSGERIVTIMLPSHGYMCRTTIDVINYMSNGNGYSGIFFNYPNSRRRVVPNVEDPHRIKIYF